MTTVLHKSYSIPVHKSGYLRDLTIFLTSATYPNIRVSTQIYSQARQGELVKLITLNMA